MQIAGIEGDAVTQKYLRLAKKVARSLHYLTNQLSLSLSSLSFFSRSLSLSREPALSLSSLARSLTRARALSLSLSFPFSRSLLSACSLSKP